MPNRNSATPFIVTLFGGIIIGLGMREQHVVANNAGEESAKAITCRSLTIEDEKGQKRIRLDVTDVGPEIRLYDRNGRRRLQLGLKTGGADMLKQELVDPYVSLFDSNEKMAAILHAASDINGNGSGAGLNLGSSKGPSYIRMEVAPFGESTLEFCTKEDSSGISLVSKPSRAAMISINDKKGDSLFSVAGFCDKGFAGLGVRTEKGKEPWQCPK